MERVFNCVTNFVYNIKSNYIFKYMNIKLMTK